MNTALALASPAAALVSSRVFPVLLGGKGRVEAGLVMLGKRAVRKGLAALTWSWGKPTTRREHLALDRACACDPGCSGCRMVTRVPLTLVGDPPQYAGWRFLAALEHLDGENLVRAVGEEPVPTAFRSRGPACDHCKVKRRRGDTFVLKHEDGRVMQVGSTCIADFLGSDDAGKLAAQASYFGMASDMAEGGCGDEGFGGGNSGSGEVDLLSFLAYAAWAVRKVGWVSRTAAREKGEDDNATADHAWRWLTDKEAAKKAEVEIADEDSALAASAAGWAEQLSDAAIDADSGDYLHNLRAVARTGLASKKRAGIAASMIVAYQREVAKAREAADRAAARALLPLADSHVGEVKKRGTWDVVLVFVTGYESRYGYTTVLRFEVEATGQTITWKASDSGVTRADAGKRYALTGTVKKHDVYREQKQTLVTRCKLVEKAATPLLTQGGN